MNSWLCLYRALLLGAALGLFYGFLRPLRPRWLGDLLFLGGLWYVWIYLVFGLCGADPRTAYTLTLLAGAGLWELLLGATLQPVFARFWHFLGHFLGGILYPFKKVLKKIFLLSI